MSKQLRTNSPGNRTKKGKVTTSSVGQLKLTDMKYPKVGVLHEDRRNITVSSRVSRKLGPWHPGFNPVTLANYRILGTVLAAESKHSWIIKWDLLKSNLTGELEHHHSVQHSGSMRLEDPLEVSNLSGIILHDVRLIRSEMEISRDYCTQPDESSSDGQLMTTSSGDDASLDKGKTSPGCEAKVGAEFESESSKGLRGSTGDTGKLDKGHQGHQGHLSTTHDESNKDSTTEPQASKTDKNLGATLNKGTPVASKRQPTLADYIHNTPLNVPVLVTPFKNVSEKEKNQKNLCVSKNMSLNDGTSVVEANEKSTRTPPQVTMIAIRDVNEYEAEFDDDADSTYCPSSILSEDDDLQSVCEIEFQNDEYSMNTHSEYYDDDDDEDSYGHNKSEPTSSQESEIPSEPIDEIDRNGFVTIDNEEEDFLSDEDGDDEDLRQKRLRYNISHKEKSAQQALKTRYKGSSVVVSEIKWIVKFDMEEISRQSDDRHLETMKFEEARSWDNVYSPYFFFEKFISEEEMSRMVDRFNHHQRMLASRCKRLGSCRNYTTIIDLYDLKKFMGLLIAAACCVDSGRNLWSPDDTRYEGYNFLKNPNFGEVMSLSKFNKIRAYFTYCFADHEKNGIDPWWYILEGLRNFNHSRKLLLRYSPTLVIDESMSAWVPKTTPCGGLPNITYVARKPEPLGTEFKVIADATTGCFISVEVQRGKKAMSTAKYVKEVKKNYCMYPTFGRKYFPIRHIIQKKSSKFKFYV